MKIIRFELADQIEYGTVKNNIVYPIVNSIFHQNLQVNDTRPIPVNQVKVLAPIVPSKIICLAGNYLSHIKEMGREPPSIPQFFYKPVTALIGPDEKIVIPSEIEGEVHYEAEIALVIRKTPPSDMREKDFHNYLVGTTILNDVTARGLQKKDGNHFRAKSFDTFCPVGPCIETTALPNRTRIQLKLNNEVKQQGSTDEMIFSFGKIIQFLANCVTLLPGDVVSTGTPAGVGPMKPGDLVEVDVERVGCLRSFVTN